MKIKSINSIQGDDPERFQTLSQRPGIAWPTVALLLAAYTVFGIATFAYLQGILSLCWTIVLNATASYLSFAVAHDATHRSVSTHPRLNDWLGRAGLLLLEPAPMLSLFRYVHMQHHGFTNDLQKDPDAGLSLGPAWLIPFKWMVFDVFYFKFYLGPDVFPKRPQSERTEFYLAIAWGIAVITGFTLAGWLHYYLLLFFIPTRIAKFFIIWVFDYLPHYPHQTHAADNRFRSTSNRVGLEWLLTPLFVYQNYHLVHHLYPRVPFYRYIKLWNAKKQYHETKNPATTRPLKLAPIKTE